MADVNTNNNQNDVISNIRKIATDLSSSLKDAAKALDKAVRESEDADKRNKDITRQFQDSLDDLSGDFTAGLNRDISNRNMNTRSLTNGVSLLGVVFNTGIKSVGIYLDTYVKAGDKLLDGFNSNIEKVTMQTGKTNAEYYQMINTFSNSITGYQSTLFDVSANLEKQFNQLDYLGEYSNLLEQGFSDNTAQTLTMSNLIAKKVVPGLNTSSREFMNISRRLGPGFAESLAEVASYLNEQNLETRLSQQDYDTLIRTLGRNIAIAGGGDQTKASNIMSNVATSYASITEKYGTDFAENFLNNINKTLDEGVNAEAGWTVSTMGTALTADQIYEMMNTEEGLASLADMYGTYLSNMYEEYGANASAIISKELGLSMDAIEDAYISKLYGGKLDAENFASQLKKNHDKDSQYQGLMLDLQNGVSQTVDEQLENQRMNDDLVLNATIFFSNISVLELNIFNTVRQGLGQILSALISGNLTSGLGNLLGGKGGSGLLGDTSGGASASIGSNIASFVGNAGLLVSAGIAVNDFSKELVESGDYVKAGVEAFVGDTDGDTLGNLLSNAVKGAGIGAKIGSMFGPLGTAMGAVTGTVVGGLANVGATLYDLADRQDPYLSSVEDVTESIQNLDTATQSYTESVKNADKATPEGSKIINEAAESMSKAIDSVHTDISRLIMDSDKIDDEEEKRAERAYEILNDPEMMGGTIEGYLKYAKNTGDIDSYNEYLSKLNEGYYSKDELYQEIVDKVLSMNDVSKEAYELATERETILPQLEESFRTALQNYKGTELEDENIRRLFNEINRVEYAYSIEDLTNNSKYKTSIQSMMTHVGGMEDLDWVAYAHILKDTPQLATGASEIPYDSYLASLHQGEMVLTADIAEGIRTMVENNSIQALPVVTSSDLSIQTNLVVNAIQAQTNELVGAIQKIYEAITSQKPETSNESDNEGISSSVLRRGMLWV